MADEQEQVQDSGDDAAAIFETSEAVDFEELRAGADKTAPSEPVPGSEVPEKSDEGEPLATTVTPTPGEESPPPTPEPDEETQKYLAQFPVFSYKADGKQQEVPGAYVAENGVFFTPKAMTWLKDQLATAFAHNGSWQRELAKAKTAGAQHAREEADRQIASKMAAAEAKAKAAQVITERIMALAEGGEEEAWEWFQNFRANLPRLMAEAERAQTKAERDELEREKSERVEQDVRRQQEGALTYLVGEYAKQYAGVDVERVKARLAQIRDRVFPRDPKTGEPLVDYGVIEDEFKYAAELLGEARTVRAAARKASAVGQQNAAAVEGAPGAPPAVSARAGARGKPGTPAAGKLRFKSREEFEEYLASGKADADGLEMLRSMG